MLIVNRQRGISLVFVDLDGAVTSYVHGAFAEVTIRDRQVDPHLEYEPNDEQLGSSDWLDHVYVSNSEEGINSLKKLSPTQPGQGGHFGTSACSLKVTVCTDLIHSSREGDKIPISPAWVIGLGEFGVADGISGYVAHTLIVSQKKFTEDSVWWPLWRSQIPRLEDKIKGK